MTAWMLRLHRHDRRVFRKLLTRQRPWPDRAMRFVTHLGGAAATISLTLTLMLGLLPSLQSAGLRAAFALAASHAVVQLLKRGVARRRPRMPVGISSIIRAPDCFSFPSGHAAASMSLALPMALALPLPLSGLVMALAVLVGLSRCYLGVHYPGDVLAGWGLAAGTVGVYPMIFG